MNSEDDKKCKILDHAYNTCGDQLSERPAHVSEADWKVTVETVWNRYYSMLENEVKNIEKGE